MATTPETGPTPALQATMLLRAARVGTLATTADGQPFASLVTPGTAPDRSVLMLLSTLSEHTRHLKTDPRCALMVTGPATGLNPQTAPRFTLTGTAEPIDNPALKARWLAQHPYAALYADFTDFALWHLTPRAGMLVGGFARAFRLKAASLAPDPTAVATIAEAADSIITHCNTDHAPTLATIAGSPGPWQMVTVDLDGCDLALGETTIRIAWSAPATNAFAIRTELISLARAARSGITP